MIEAKWRIFEKTNPRCDQYQDRPNKKEHLIDQEITSSNMKKLRCCEFFKMPEYRKIILPLPNKIG